MGDLHKWVMGSSALLAWAGAMAPGAAMAREQVHVFNIPTQPLPAALIAFSRQSNEMIVAAPEDTAGKRSHAVSGSLGSQAAIQRLLSGTGLSAMTAPQGGYLITREPLKKTQIAAAPAPVTAYQGPVQRQAPADETVAPVGQLSEIVVTAQRREERLLDVPVAVTAIQAGTLETRQITDVSSLQQLAPSLTSAPFGDATSPLLSIRGQVAQDIVASIDPAVGVYLDGVYLGRATGANLDFLDVERVEVLRGPQGTLFGRNTIGGAISITPKHPSDVLEGKIEARYGNYNEFGVTAIANIPVSAGAGFRIVGSHSQRDGFAKSTLTGAELSAKNLEYVRASFGAELGANWDVLLSGDFSDSRNNGQWLTLIKTYPIGNTVAALVSGGTQTATQYVDPFTRRPASFTTGPAISRNWGGSGTINGQIGAVNFKSITAYREIKRRLGRFDQDATPFELLDIYGNDSDQNQFSQEFQLYGKALDDRLDWIAGVYYFKEEGRDTVTSHNLFPLSTTYVITDAIAKNRNVAVYGQLTYNLTDQLSVFGGIRYTKDTRKLILFSRNAGATPETVTSCAVTGAVVPVCRAELPRKSFDYFPFTLGANFKPGDRSLIYLKWSRGFRSGGFNTRGATEAQLLPFAPERVDSYELGAKFEINRRFRVNADIYQSDFNNQQLLAVIPGSTIAINQNAGTSRIRGFEFEGEAVFGPLTINGSLALTDAEYRKILPNVVGVQIDSPFTFTPKTAWSLGADYTIPGSFGKIVLHADYNWRSKAFFAPSPPRDPLAVQQTSYGLLNASITANLGERITLRAYGKNLTNKDYFTRTTDIGALGFANAYIGDPRTYGIAATYRF